MEAAVLLAVIGLCACAWLSQFFFVLKARDRAFLALAIYFAATAAALAWFCFVVILSLSFGHSTLAQNPWRPLVYLIISDAALFYLMHALRPRSG